MYYRGKHTTIRTLGSISAEEFTTGEVHVARPRDDNEYKVHPILYMEAFILLLVGTGMVGVQNLIPYFLPTVYLRSSPEVCYRRLLQRGREEEKTVTLVSKCV